MKKLKDLIIMVRPTYFKSNPEAIKTNHFMQRLDCEDTEINKMALMEFENMVELLEGHQIEINVLESRPNTPDAVFPNNWFSTHQVKNEHYLILYPMLNPNRSIERNPTELIEQLKKHNIKIKKIFDLTHFESSGPPLALEGTGSLIFDPLSNKVMMATSSRSNLTVLEQWKSLEPVRHHDILHFDATDTQGREFYHTNVIMSLGHHFALWSKETIKSIPKRNQLEEALKFPQGQGSERKVIDINQSQIDHMCGNILEVYNKNHAPFIVMSKQAYDHFDLLQKKVLESAGQLIIVPIPTIEKIGGGSARCMMGNVRQVIT